MAIIKAYTVLFVVGEMALVTRTYEGHGAGLSWWTEKRVLPIA